MDCSTFKITLPKTTCLPTWSKQSNAPCKTRTMGF